MYLVDIYTWTRVSLLRWNLFLVGNFLGFRPVPPEVILSLRINDSGYQTSYQDQLLDDYDA